MTNRGDVPPTPRRFVTATNRQRHRDLVDLIIAVGTVIVGGGFGGLVGVRLGIGFFAGAALGALTCWALVRAIGGGVGRMMEGVTEWSTTRTAVSTRTLSRWRSGGCSRRPRRITSARCSHHRTTLNPI